MKNKLLLFVGLFLVAVLAAVQFVAPKLIEATLAHELKETVVSNDTMLTLSSTPKALIAAGYIDNLAAVARNAKLGEVYSAEVTLDGTGLKFDMPILVKEGKVVLQKSDSLALKAIFSEENLRELLANKVDKLSNVHVDITPDRVFMTADVKLFGKPAEAQVEGILLQDGGSLYFRMTRMNMKNALLGRLNLENFFGDILLVNNSKLPLNLKIDEVIMQEHHVTVTATRPANE